MPDFPELTIQLPMRKSPQPKISIHRDPHRSSLLLISLPVETDWLIDRYKCGIEDDVRAEVLSLLYDQCVRAVDEMLSRAREKVPNHP